jgi:uncharacterized BrkB/YihY/UPF0761 family membrane protein
MVEYCRAGLRLMNEKNLSILAAGVAYFAMLSIFPALAALIALYGLVADPSTVAHQINAISGVIPAQAQHLIAEYLKTLINASSSKLGIGLVLSVLIALWGARSGTISLIEALNITYEEEEKRGIIRFQWPRKSPLHSQGGMWMYGERQASSSMPARCRQDCGWAADGYEG